MNKQEESFHIKCAFVFIFIFPLKILYFFWGSFFSLCFRCYKRIYIQQLNQTKNKHREIEEWINERTLSSKRKTQSRKTKDHLDNRLFLVEFFFCSLKWKKKQIEEEEKTKREYIKQQIC